MFSVAGVASDLIVFPCMDFLHAYFWLGCCLRVHDDIIGDVIMCSCTAG